MAQYSDGLIRGVRYDGGVKVPGILDGYREQKAGFWFIVTTVATELGRSRLLPHQWQRLDKLLRRGSTEWLGIGGE
jgi:hypothetical protein